MNKRYLTGLLVAFLALELVLTFWQNYQLPLDGDLTPVVAPAPTYTQVLHDPFGLSAVVKHEVYAAPNRFFAHAAMFYYWRSVPLLLQHVVSPISSLYAASALFTTATYALLLFMLTAYVREAVGRPGPRWLGFCTVAALLAPLFQTDGFNEQMGITNPAVTYTFFYGFPMALLLVLLWPFYQAACRRQPLRLHPLQIVPLVGLMVVIAFNGPIPIAAMAVLLFGIGLYWVWQQWRTRPWQLRLSTPGTAWLSWQAALMLAILTALSAYSLFLGRYNAENANDHTLGQLYQLLPRGVYIQLTWQNGLPVLLALLLANAQLIRWCTGASPERQRVLVMMRWVGLFAVIYVLLLPFGGYRPYRPFLLRNDSVLPILLGIFFAYGISTSFLLQQLRGRLRGGYLAVVCLVGAFFMYADRAIEMPVNNGCERWAMDQLARSTEPTVQIAGFCNVLSWIPLTDPSQSLLQAQMLHYWGVTNAPRPYYQR